VINSRSQQGALIFATPLLLVLLFFFVVLLIDGARVLSVRSEMQAVVNAAATAAADEAQSCGGLEPDYASMKNRALAAARAVGFTGDGSELEVIPGILRTDSNEESQLRFLSRTPATQMRQTNAAWVEYTRSEPVSTLMPSGSIPPIELTAAAAARKEVVAILSAGGSTVSVNGGLLGGLVGGVTGIPNYSLDATDLNSLQNTLIGVGDLADTLGLASLTELADAPLIDVVAAVTTLAGGTLTPAGSLLDDLSGATGLSGLDGSAVFDVAGSPPESLDASFPAYDFATSVLLNSVRAVNQSGAGLLEVGLDSSESSVLSSLTGAISLLGDVELTLGLQVNEPPRIVIGPARQDDNGAWLTRVHTADILLEVAVDVELASSAVGGLVSALGLGLVNVSLVDEIRIPLVVETGGGDAALIGADCAQGSNNTVDFDFEVDSNIAEIQTGTVDNGTGSIVSEPISATILKVTALFLNVNLCLDADLDIALEGGVQQSELDAYGLYCPDGECGVSGISGGSGGLDGLSVTVEDIALDCGGGGLTGIASSLASGLVVPLTGLLSDVTEGVIGGIVSPLLSALGVGLGGVEIRVLGADQTAAHIVENVTFE